MHLELDTTELALHSFIVEVLCRILSFFVKSCQRREEVHEWNPPESRIEAHDEVVDYCCLASECLQVYEDHLENSMQDRTC